MLRKPLRDAKGLPQAVSLSKIVNAGFALATCEDHRREAGELGGPPTEGVDYALSNRQGEVSTGEKEASTATATALGQRTRRRGHLRW